MRILLAISFAVTASGLTVGTGGCVATPLPPSVSLRGFTKGNYTALERSLGRYTCVTGTLSVDSMGVYFPLQPMEEDNVIDIGFSRVDTGLKRSVVLKEGLIGGRVYTVCGLLKHATPFKGCETNDCKWYALTDAKLSRKASNPGINSKEPDR